MKLSFGAQKNKKKHQKGKSGFTLIMLPFPQAVVSPERVYILQWGKKAQGRHPASPAFQGAFQEVKPKWTLPKQGALPVNHRPQPATSPRQKSQPVTPPNCGGQPQAPPAYGAKPELCLSMFNIVNCTTYVQGAQPVTSHEKGDCGAQTAAPPDLKGQTVAPY